MNVDQTDANPSMDMEAHVKSYQNFVIFVKYGIASVAAILIFMALFLV